MLKTRTSTRLAAVQAIFQLNATDDTAIKVVNDFCSFRYTNSKKSENINKIDFKFFKDIVYGAHSKQENIKIILSDGLSKDWRIERLDPTLKALLILGIYELSFNKDIPVSVVIDEYVSIASFFFDKEEIGFANGLLDNIAKKIRLVEEND